VSLCPKKSDTLGTGVLGWIINKIGDVSLRRKIEEFYCKSGDGSDRQK
jgi:hypothetical protein